MTDLVWTPVKIRLGQIRPWIDNPRMSTKAQAQRLIKSERELGQIQTLAVSPFDGDFVDLYDGHQRVSAWMTVKDASYEVTALQSNRKLTDDERKKVSVLLHTATGSWDWNALSSWSSADLREWGMDGDSLKGWQTDVTNLKELLNSENDEPVDAEPQIDRAAELQEKWQTCTGQLWKLREHRLLIGDCTVRENVERLMGGERADMVFTDPPYGMDLDTDYSTLKSGEGKSIKHEKVIGDDVAFDPKHIFDLFDYCAEILLFGADYYLPRIPNWDSGTWLIWDKRVQENYDKVIGSSFEVLWSKRKRRKEIFRFEYVNWGSRMADGAKLHPTMKPVKLIERIIEPIDVNIIVDIYAGSGTTILAAHNLNRRCYAMEISEKYGAVILERFFTATGITPELVE